MIEIRCRADGAVSVRDTDGSGAWYEIANPEATFPRCNCPAGRWGTACKHVVAWQEHLAAGKDGEMTETTRAVALAPRQSMTQKAEETRLALAAVRGGIEDAIAIAKMQEAMWPDEIKNLPPDKGARTAGLIVQTAVELGVSALSAFSYITVIKGKPFLMARMINALVSSRVPGGYIAVTSRTPTEATAMAVRPGRPNQTVRITIQDAQKAGWAKNALYQTNPAAMLAARATTTVGWLAFADVLAGMDAYDAETGEEMYAAQVEAVPAAAIAVEEVPADPGEEPMEGQYREPPPEQQIVFLEATAAMLARQGSGWGQLRNAMRFEGNTQTAVRQALLTWWNEFEFTDTEQAVKALEEALTAYREALNLSADQPALAIE